MNSVSMSIGSEVWAALKECPQATRRAVVEALCFYAVDGIEMELKGTARALFLLAKRVMSGEGAKASLQVSEKEEEATAVKPRRGGQPGNRNNRWSKRDTSTNTGEESTNTSTNTGEESTNTSTNTGGAHTLSQDNIINNSQVRKTNNAREPKAKPRVPWEKCDAELLAWLKTNAEYIYSHYTKLISTEQLQRLIDGGFTLDDVHNMILTIENRVDLRKKYTDLFRTVTNWLNKEQKYEQSRTTGAGAGAPAYPGRTTAASQMAAANAELARQAQDVCYNIQQADEAWRRNREAGGGC